MAPCSGGLYPSRSHHVCTWSERASAGLGDRKSGLFRSSLPDVKSTPAGEMPGPPTRDPSSLKSGVCERREDGNTLGRHARTFTVTKPTLGETTRSESTRPGREAGAPAHLAQAPSSAVTRRAILTLAQAKSAPNCWAPGLCPVAAAWAAGGTGHSQGADGAGPG